MLPTEFGSSRKRQRWSNGPSRCTAQSSNSMNYGNNRGRGNSRGGGNKSYYGRGEQQSDRGRGGRGRSGRGGASRNYLKRDMIGDPWRDLTREQVLSGKVHPKELCIDFEPDIPALQVLDVPTKETTNTSGDHRFFKNSMLADPWTTQDQGIGIDSIPSSSSSSTSSSSESENDNDSS
mmetsp:Transcript_9321/g.14037  ORF Transcript_9321/g.14037 Transcript_9321/m.14037 type:complete len:178 (+) Transcript_9321:62-595(+)